MKTKDITVVGDNLTIRLLAAIIVLGVVASSTVSASAQTQIEKPGRLTQGQKLTLDFGSPGEIPLRSTSRNDAAAGTNADIYNPTTNTWSLTGPMTANQTNLIRALQTGTFQERDGALEQILEIPPAERSEQS